MNPIVGESKLTPRELKAVTLFISAAKALPKTICIEVEDDYCGSAILIVSKRMDRRGLRCEVVAELQKKSLMF